MGRIGVHTAWGGHCSLPPLQAGPMGLFMEGKGSTLLSFWRGAKLVTRAGLLFCLIWLCLMNQALLVHTLVLPLSNQALPTQ